MVERERQISDLRITVTSSFTETRRATHAQREMGGGEKRHQMMQNLFGDQSEEEEEVDSEHESNPQPNFASVILYFVFLFFFFQLFIYLFIMQIAY